MPASNGMWMYSEGGMALPVFLMSSSTLSNPPGAMTSGRCGSSQQEGRIEE